MAVSLSNGFVFIDHFLKRNDLDLKISFELMLSC